MAGTLAMFATAQLSVAVTTNVTLLEHVPANTFTTRLVEQVITGDCTSFTVSAEVHASQLPPPTDAVRVTLLVHTAKMLPLAGTLAMFVTAQFPHAYTTTTR